MTPRGKEKQALTTAKQLSAELATFMNKTLLPRQQRLSQLANAWHAILPEELSRHSCVESLRKGQLRILVDSAGHLYELKLLMREGLVDELRRKCPTVALWRVRLARGRWYKVNEDGAQISTYPGHNRAWQHRSQASLGAGGRLETAMPQEQADDSP